jgi:hypothetical protein
VRFVTIKLTHYPHLGWPRAMASLGNGPAFLPAEANDRFGSRPCENGWWRGVERPWHLRFRLQESGVFQPLWWLDGSRVRAVRSSNGGTALSDILTVRATS